MRLSPIIIMASVSGIFQRPLVAAAAAAVASLSADLPDKFSPPKSSDPSLSSELSKSSVTHSNSVQETNSWVSHISISRLTDLSFVSRTPVPVPNIKYPAHRLGGKFVSSISCSSISSSPVLFNLYQSAELAKAPKPNLFAQHAPNVLPSEVLYRWHLPEPDSYDVNAARSRTVVVLLGWLGAKQKHLKRYAEWYTSMGFHVITFTFPMAEIMSYQVGGKAEQNIELLVNHLAGWLEEEHGKNLVFHTFSNTGWLTYGVILEKFQKQDPSLMGRIKGCIVDSAPVPAPDPQVWASGFSAAFLKKHSVATKGFMASNESHEEEVLVSNKTDGEPKAAVTEEALLLILEKFFEVILNLPTVNRRLSDVLNLLSSRQPKCAQLYIYSSADRVIPAESVESFVEDQRRAGHEVRACNFVSTPHVDHFRGDPNLYTSELTRFLEEDCVLACCTNSSRVTHTTNQ